MTLINKNEKNKLLKKDMVESMSLITQKIANFSSFNFKKSISFFFVIASISFNWNICNLVANPVITDCLILSDA